MSRKDTSKSYSFTLAQEPDSLRLAVWYIVYKAMSREELDKLLKGEQATARLKDDQRDKEDFDWLYLLDDEPYYEGELEEEDEARATKVVGPRMPGGVIGRIYRFWKKRHSKGRFQEYFPVNISKKIEKIYKEIEDARKKLDDAEDEEALHPTPKAVTTDPRTDEWFKPFIDLLAGVPYSQEMRNVYFQQMLQCNGPDERKDFIEHFVQDMEKLLRDADMLYNRTVTAKIKEASMKLQTAYNDINEKEAAKQEPYDFTLDGAKRNELLATQILGQLKFYTTDGKGNVKEMLPQEEFEQAVKAAKEVEDVARRYAMPIDQAMQLQIANLLSQGAMRRSPDDPFTGQVKHKLKTTKEVCDGKMLREYLKTRYTTRYGEEKYVQNFNKIQSCLGHFKDNREYTFSEIEDWLKKNDLDPFALIPQMYEDVETQYRAK